MLPIDGFETPRGTDEQEIKQKASPTGNMDGLGGGGSTAHRNAPGHAPAGKRSLVVEGGGAERGRSPRRRKFGVSVDHPVFETGQAGNGMWGGKGKAETEEDGVQASLGSDGGDLKSEDKLKAAWQGSRVSPTGSSSGIVSANSGGTGGSSRAGTPASATAGPLGSRGCTPPGTILSPLASSKQNGSMLLPAVPVGSPRMLSPPKLSSPGSLGSRRMPWKLASHTVKLNRYQGTVERYESLWSGRAGSLDASIGAPSGTWSGPHTPRSLRPLTPTGGSPLPFDSPRAQLRGVDSPTNSSSLHMPRPLAVLNSQQALHHQSVCSALSSAADGGSSSGGVVKAAVPLIIQRPRNGSSSERALFEMQSAPNQLLEALRFFELPLPEKHKPAFSWGTQQQDRLHLLARYIEAVARDVRKLCLAEPRCVHVHAPCYILGDLHGNYQDLIAFEKALWRIGLSLSPANFLFLGDYVDRGAHSLEVIIYLLAQKALCPGKIVLLRGNHEIRTQNSHPGYNPCFKQSCEATLGPDLGAQVWESINLAFDTFPVAAIVDNNIFCVHGGIPAPDVMARNVVAGGT